MSAVTCCALFKSPKEGAQNIVQLPVTQQLRKNILCIGYFSATKIGNDRKVDVGKSGHI